PEAWVGALFWSLRGKSALNCSKRSGGRRLCIDRGGFIAEFVDRMSSFPDWGRCEKRRGRLSTPALSHSAVMPCKVLDNGLPHERPKPPTSRLDDRGPRVARGASAALHRDRVCTPPR